MVRDLGEGLCGRETYAAWYADPAEDLGAESATVAFPAPTAATPAILSAIRPAAARLFVAGRRYRRAGVLLCGIEPAGGAADLFAGDPSETKEAKLSAALDAVNAKFGRGTVFLAASGTSRPWRMKRDLLSPGSRLLVDRKSVV